MITFDECGKFQFEKNFIHMRRTMRFNELILMRKGTMYLAFEDEHLTVRENDLVFLPANRLHYGWRESEEKVEFYWVHFLTDEEITIPLIYHLDNSTQAIQLFRQVFHFAYIKGSDADCATTLLIHGIQNEISGNNNPHLLLGSEICKWIEKHFSENINVTSIAREFGYSPDYISAKVRDKTGKSAKSYITFCRIASAKQILLCSHLPVDDVAEQCGFTDSKAFFKIFKKHEGVTPTQYRKTFPNADRVGISIRRINNA